ncbi:hypothetical protein BGW36DRAFT_367155 [Talaromyces proteolyticus]|uniref:Transcriptional activator of proteases prtT n=1 Tax=Talaromyces proteolyticus TaxID=1131652 RepID=A0AAD4L547_9EURO|nr:uncharacterized protein BGW36DRAFT_367155 [Talaromyces proteolyticus]KAH8705241.1 hypothetical protein BGW36DRAFT_367155 [Talaromyces proteolyticus]
MPPLRSGRASKACDLCRKCKTRCYASQGAKGSCLRCSTLSQVCSLNAENNHSISLAERERHIVTDDTSSSNGSNSIQQRIPVHERLTRLERTVEALVDRIDARFNELAGTASNTQIRTIKSTAETDTNTAPVFLIRDAATDAGVHTPELIQSHHRSTHSDVISTGLVTLSTAHSLLELFHIHYGRWVKFPEDISTTVLLPRIRKSPLLICSIFLISVRHTTQELADRLAPELFQEAKRLVSSSLLITPQSLEFFQAVLILSLWSTTIGQVPLSVDSWLLTGYALQQVSVSPDFVEVFQVRSIAQTARSQLDAWCLWNHLCLAHLQYCVGTRRQALLNQEQINHCVRFIESDNITNYEARMAAEISLYWVIYRKCCGSDINMSETKVALQTWHQEWMALLNQPRSQFLQMGFHFAHLLAYGQCLKSPSRLRGGLSVVETIATEMIYQSKTIINLVIETTDERTRHLTDQIYHIVTFSALTLCRLVHTYESKLRAANHDIEALDSLVTKLIDWLRSIGLPCHAAHMLGGILATQFSKLRPYARPGVSNVTDCDINFSALNHQSLPTDLGVLYPDFLGSELFNIAMDTAPWPQWGAMYQDNDL